jgi:D-aminopeptidase
MTRVVLGTDVASLSYKGRLPASLAARLVGREICVTFVTVGELARWAEKRHWGTRTRARPINDTWIAACCLVADLPLARYMMQGLDPTADLVFMVGYHGSISGESSVLSHTYNPSVISHVELNGVRVGESGINALAALGGQVPVGLITGDQHTAAEAEVASWVRGAERTGLRAVSIRGDDPLAMFRSFVAVTYITRVAEGR